MVLNPDEVNSRFIIEYGIFAPAETQIFWSLLQNECKKDPPPLVVDVGANLGWFTLFAASMGCRVISFEPNSLAMTFLKISVKFNNFEHLVTFYPYGIGSKRENKTFSRGGGHWGVGKFTDDLANFDQIMTIVPLDEMIQEDVFLLKIDTEGYEKEIFEGMFKMLETFHVSNILAEVKLDFSNNKQKEREKIPLLQRIRKNGFTGFYYREFYGNQPLDASLWRLLPAPLEAELIGEDFKFSTEDILFTRDPEIIKALDIPWRDFGKQ